MSVSETRNLEIYDTTLRDGTQAEGVNVSLADKLAITKALDDFGVAFIEGAGRAPTLRMKLFLKMSAS